MVQPHYNLRGVVFLKGMSDAVGDVGGKAALGEHPHVNGTGNPRCLLQCALADRLVVLAVLIVVHHVEANQSATELLVVHHKGEVYESVCGTTRPESHENLLVVALPAALHVLSLGESDGAGGTVCDHRAYHTGEENHYDHAVQHVGVNEIFPRRRGKLHSHHYDGYGAGGMGRGQSEHHVTVGQRQAEQSLRQVCRYRLAEGAEEDDAEDDKCCVPAVEEHADVYQHSHADKEIGDEESVADELDTVHER